MYVCMYVCITHTAWMQLQVKRKTKFKKSTEFVTHMKWQEVYFDIMSAVVHALLGSISLSESMHTYSSPEPTAAN